MEIIGFLVCCLLCWWIIKKFMLPIFLIAFAIGVLITIISTIIKIVKAKYGLIEMDDEDEDLELDIYP